MDTIVTARAMSDRPAAEVQAALERALGWFDEVERVCSRFDRGSEVFQLASKAGEPVAVSRLLFEAVRFSLAVAEASGGAFDPTVGVRQAQRGFDRNYISGERIAAPAPSERVSYRDVAIDAEQGAITLRRPLLLDLGGVAKGMAIDLAAQDLAQSFESYTIDAGGDLYVQGRNDQGQPWRVGIEHPRRDGLIATLAVDQGAICTSGDYQRPAATEGEHHLLDPRSGRSPRDLISCTVVAPTAMAADALSTAAFVMGPTDGLRLLDEQGVDGMIVDRQLHTSMTSGFKKWLA